MHKYTYIYNVSPKFIIRWSPFDPYLLSKSSLKMKKKNSKHISKIVYKIVLGNFLKLSLQNEIWNNLDICLEYSKKIREIKKLKEIERNWKRSSSISCMKLY